MGCGETKDPRSVPRSLFLAPISLHSARSNFARVPVSPFFPPWVPRFSRLHPPPCQFLLFTWLAAAERKDTERKRAELARFSLISISASLIQFPPLSFSRALHLPAVAAVRWFVNAKFKLSRAALLEPLRRQWRYQHIHSFQIPPRAIPRNAETSIPMRQETREKGEERRAPVSRGFSCHCERILSVAVQIKSWLSMKFETLAYDLSHSIRRTFYNAFLISQNIVATFFLHFIPCFPFQI